MNLVKALDAAFPPSPAEWVADLQSVGAKVGFAYCPTFGGGGSGHYTSAHVEAAEAAGIRVVPIVVPGGSPPSPPLYAAAWPLGMTGGSIVYDIARGDGTPSAAWVEQAAAEGLAADPVWDPWCYLQPDLRSTFPWGKEWAAIPGAEPTSLPDGANGVQYGFDVVINGHNYDVSVIDLDALVASPSAAPVSPPAPPAVPAPAPAPAAPPAFREQVVVKGDTLSHIAAEDGESLAEVEHDNPQIANPDLIYPGEAVNIETSAPATAPAPSGALYSISHAVPGYVTAADAAAGHNSNGTVPPGTYAVFNRADGMVNITRQAGVPGWWINPAS